MTVQIQTPYNQYSANGATTVFAFEFQILRETDLKVKVNGLLVTNYTVSGVGDAGGGSITFATAPAAGTLNVLLYRDVPLARAVAYTTNGPFPATTVNQDFDLLWHTLQSVSARNGGEIRLPLPDQAGELPFRTERYDRLLGFSETAGLPEMTPFTVTQLASTIAAAYTGAAGPLDALSFIQAGTDAVSLSAQAVLRQMWVTPQQFGAVGDGVADDSSAFAKAFATGKPVYVPPGTYIAAMSVRRNNVCMIGAGSSAVTIRQPAGALSVGGVFEVGDTASGNSATAYTGLVVRGVTLDGNRANTTAPTDDLHGHGLILTKISHWHISDVRAINCHNAGVIPVINSNYGSGDCYVENCGNATYTAVGFDINSSKYINVDVVSKDCYSGARVLDNCWGINGRFTAHNPTKHGFICNNQSVNTSHTNNFDVAVYEPGEHGVILGENVRSNNIRATVHSATGFGMIITDFGASSASENVITLNTNNGDLPGLACYGHDNSITHVSYRDGRAGSAGSNFACDVLGDRNTLTVSVTDTSTFQVRGLAIRSGAADNVVAALTGNSADMYNDAGTRTRYSRGSSVTTVASGNPLDPGINATTVIVTGTTNSGDVPVAGNAGRTITFVFEDVLTVGDSGTMNLQGPFVTSAGATLTVACDGSSWYEVSRSSNGSTRASGTIVGDGGSPTATVVDGIVTVIA